METGSDMEHYGLSLAEHGHILPDGGLRAREWMATNE